MAQKSRNMFSHSSRGWDSEIKVLAGLSSHKRSRRESFFTSPCFRWLLAFLGLWQHLSNICLCLQMAISLSLFPLLFSCKNLSLHLSFTLIHLSLKFFLMYPKFLLEHSCLMGLCQFLLYSKGNHLYMYTSPFLDFLPIQVTYFEILNHGICKDLFSK